MAASVMPFGCFTLLRSLSQFLQLTPLQPSVPLLVCSKAVSHSTNLYTALLHPAALHQQAPPAQLPVLVGSVRQHPNALLLQSKPLLRSCALPGFKGRYGGQCIPSQPERLLPVCTSGQLWRSGWRTWRATVRSSLVAAPLPQHLDDNHQLKEKSSTFLAVQPETDILLRRDK